MELVQLRDYATELETLILTIKLERSDTDPFFPEVADLLDQAVEVEKVGKQKSIELHIQAAQLWLEKIREHKKSTANDTGTSTSQPGQLEVST